MASQRFSWQCWPHSENLNQIIFCRHRANKKRSKINLWLKEKLSLQGRIQHALIYNQLRALLEERDELYYRQANRTRPAKLHARKRERTVPSSDPESDEDVDVEDVGEENVDDENSEGLVLSQLAPNLSQEHPVDLGSDFSFASLFRPLTD